MSPGWALGALVLLVALATVIGVLLKKRDGRSKAVTTHGAILPEDLALPADAFGDRATLVQFSTVMCAKCPATRRLLVEEASRREGVVHVDVDLTHRADLATRFSVLQTPTTLVLDARGVPTARIAGAPTRATVIAALDRLEGAIHV
ncbi:MAG: thioredoxin family protein [Microbacterium sp.]